MNRKTTTIILVSILLSILAFSIIFGTVVTCINRQEPLVTLDITLSSAINRGLAENYDYFVKTEIANREYNGEKTYRYANSIIYIRDDTLGNNFKLDFWYCKYLLTSQRSGMCEVTDIDLGDIETFLDRAYYRSFYSINNKVEVFTIDTYSHSDSNKRPYFDYYFVLTASQEIIDETSRRYPPNSNN